MWGRTRWGQTCHGAKPAATPCTTLLRVSESSPLLMAVADDVFSSSIIFVKQELTSFWSFLTECTRLCKFSLFPWQDSPEWRSCLNSINVLLLFVNTPTTAILILLVPSPFLLKSRPRRKQETPVVNRWTRFENVSNWFTCRFTWDLGGNLVDLGWWPILRGSLQHMRKYELLGRGLTAGPTIKSMSSWISLQVKWLLVKYVLFLEPWSLSR